MLLSQADLASIQAQYPDHRLELVNGKVIVMSPSGYESDEVAAEAIRLLGNWVRPRRLGRVAASSAGFRLPNANQDVRAPDASFVSAERLRRSPQSFAELAPDLMIEVKSPTDSLDELEAKISEFLSLGTQVALLINPQTQTVAVYRAEQPAVILANQDRLTLPDILPGWEVSVAELWPLVFE
ncbi:MAG: Uma2 family endonuclease [Cyanobacteria bacterium P01_H01_bin.119]